VAASTENTAKLSVFAQKGNSPARPQGLTLQEFSIAQMAVFSQGQDPVVIHPWSSANTLAIVSLFLLWQTDSNSPFEGAELREVQFP